MSLEEDQNKRFKDYVVQKVRSIKKSKNAYIFLKREGIYGAKFGHGCSIISSSSINCYDKKSEANWYLLVIVVKFLLEHPNLVM